MFILAAILITSIVRVYFKIQLSSFMLYYKYIFISPFHEMQTLESFQGNVNYFETQKLRKCLIIKIMPYKSLTH